MVSKLTVLPTRVGVLFDWEFLDVDELDTIDLRNDILDGLRLTFDETHGSGLLERPVELVVRDVNGPPNGRFGNVYRAFHELIEEDCVAIIGPYWSESAVPLGEWVQKAARVPILAGAVSESYLGEWAFGFGPGQIVEEPLILAHVLAHDGYRRVGLAFDRSNLGAEYRDGFQRACERVGIDLVSEVAVPAVVTVPTDAMETLRAARPDAIVYLGSGYGIYGINEALTKIGWDPLPPRYTGTALQMVFIGRDFMEKMAGWIGLDVLDERNQVGEQLMDRFEARYGRRPHDTLVNLSHDMAQVLSLAIADAQPMTGRGVKEALERVKLVPAACGAPGTRIRFGKWSRIPWVGAEYLVARRVLPDGSDHVFHGTIEGTVGPIH